MKIAILGCTGFKNRGVDALVTCSLAGLSEAFPSASLSIFTWTSDYDRQRISNDMVNVFEYPYRPRRLSPPPPSSSLGKKQWLWNQGRRLKRSVFSQVATVPNHPHVHLVCPDLAGMLRGFDLAVIMGGDVYSSEYGLESLGYYLSLIHTAHSLDVPVALLGHSIGRFSDSQSKAAWLDACKSISFLTTRDSITYEYLKEIHGLPFNSYISADVGFGLPKAKPYPVPRRSSSPLVALSVSAGIAHWAGISLAEYTQAWLKIIRTILDCWKCDVVLIPHVQEAYGDDRIIQTRLHRQLAFDSRVSIAAADLSASEYKAIISDADFLIAERMHAAIAGISSFVPTVIVSYSLKAQGLAFEAYGEDILSHVPPLYQASDYRNISHVLESLQIAWYARYDLQHSLEENVPKLVARASDSFALLEQWYRTR